MSETDKKLEIIDEQNNKAMKFRKFTVWGLFGVSTFFFIKERERVNKLMKAG